MPYFQCHPLLVYSSLGEASLAQEKLRRVYPKQEEFAISISHFQRQSPYLNPRTVASEPSPAAGRRKRKVGTDLWRRPVEAAGRRGDAARVRAALN